MASTDATPVPVKNQAYRVTFPIFDADGDLVTGATTPDSEVSKDAGTFADCTNEATEIATSSGMYYLDLTATEMNADTVAIIVKTATAGAKTTPIVLYPAEAADIPVNVTAISGDTVAADNAELDYDGTGYAKTNSTTGLLAGAITSAKFAAGAIDAAAIANGAIDAATFAAGAIDAAAIADNAIDAAAIATDAITAAKIAADAIGSSEFAQAAADKVWSTAARILTANTNFNDPTAAAVADAVWDEAKAGHVAAGSFGEEEQLHALSSEVATVEGKLDTVDTVVDAILDDTGTSGVVVAAASKTGYALSSAGVQAIWDALTAALTTVSSIGKLLVDNINATISSRSSQTSVDTVDTVVDSILADTGTDGVVVAAASKTGYTITQGEHTNIADALLKRDLSAVTGEAARSVLNAVRFLRNKWSIAGTTLTVTKEDDSTSAWTATVTTDAAADPVTASDPA